MGQFDIQHNDRQYTINEESYVTNDKPPYTDVNITAITEEGCIWRLNPLMNLKGSSSYGVYRRCFLQASITSAFYGRTEKRIEKLFKRAVNRLP